MTRRRRTITPTGSISSLRAATGLAVKDAAIVGEDGPRSDLIVMPWPSDHRAVVAEVTF